MPTRRRNKISRRTKKNKKNSVTRRHRGGDKDGPMHPDTPREPSPDKQYVRLINRTVETIIKEQIDAEKMGSDWQKDVTRDAANQLDMTVVVTSPYLPSPFWGNLFTPDEINNIITMLKQPSLCDEVIRFLPAFENKPLELIDSQRGVMRNGMMVFSDDKQKQTDDWNERCNMICSTLIILGIISSKMQTTNQDYTIISKGGLSVSLMLSQIIGNNIKVQVNDLDFKIIPAAKIQYIQEHANNLAMHIGALVQQILTEVINKDKGYEMKLRAPATSAQTPAYRDLVKLSLKPRDSGYIPILDLDFGDHKTTNMFFNKLFRIDGELPANADAPVRFPVSFVYQSDRLMLAEKLYYYSQYFFFKNWLMAILSGQVKLNIRHNQKIVTPFGDIMYVPRSGEIIHNDTHITMEVCDYYLDKFWMSISLMTNAIVESRDLVTKEQFLLLKDNPHSDYNMFRQIVKRIFIYNTMYNLSREQLFPGISLVSIAPGLFKKGNKHTTDKMSPKILDIRIVYYIVDSLYQSPV